MCDEGMTMCGCGGRVTATPTTSSSVALKACGVTFRINGTGLIAIFEQTNPKASREKGRCRAATINVLIRRERHLYRRELQRPATSDVVGKWYESRLSAF
jgi:hypothetical protein